MTGTPESRQAARRSFPVRLGLMTFFDTYVLAKFIDRRPLPVAAFTTATALKGRCDRSFFLIHSGTFRRLIPSIGRYAVIGCRLQSSRIILYTQSQYCANEGCKTSASVAGLVARFIDVVIRALLTETVTTMMLAGYHVVPFWTASSLPCISCVSLPLGGGVVSNGETTTRFIRVGGADQSTASFVRVTCISVSYSSAADAANTQLFHHTSI